MVGGSVRGRLGSATAAVTTGVWLFPAVAAAGGAGGLVASSSAAAHAVRWGCLIGLGVVLLILLIGLLVGARVTTLFVGADNRVSTSKTIAIVWTLLVAAVLFGLIYANLLNHPQALNATENSGVIGQYAVLFGGPLGAAILAKGIVTNQTTGKDAVAKPPATAPSPKDLIANDAGDTDLGDFQYVLFNAVALFYVVSTLLHSPLHGLPHIPDVLLGLTSVSAVGYIGKKVVTPGGTVTAKIQNSPPEGPVGTSVRVEVDALAETQTTVDAKVTFNHDASTEVSFSEPVAGGSAVLATPAPPLNLAAGTKVDVTVVLDNGMILNAGTYTYR